MPTFAEAGIARHGDLAVDRHRGADQHAARDRRAAAGRDPTDPGAGDVETALEAIAVEPRSTTPEEYRDLIARDTARWKAVAATANIKLE